MKRCGESGTCKQQACGAKKTNPEHVKTPVAPARRREGHWNR
jgi:hypothetical protein